jgi:hypothetical protein
MATYVLPSFNLPVNIWRAASPPPAPPAISTVGNLSPGRIMGVPPIGVGMDEPIMGGMWLRLPPGTDVRDAKWGGADDIVEAPAGSGRMYTVAWVDDIGLGFVNEHRFAVLAGKPSWPTPFPGGGGGPPPPPPHAFYTPTTGNSGGLGVNALGLMSGAVAGASDGMLFAICYANITGGAIAVTCDGLAVPGFTNVAVPPSLGITAFLGVTYFSNGVGTHLWQAQMSGANTAYMMMACVNVTNLSLVGLHGPGTNTGLHTPPVSVSMSGGEVTVAGTVVGSAFLELSAANVPNNFAAPFVDFSPPQSMAVLGNFLLMNFGGIAAAPAVPTTATRNAGATFNTWGGVAIGLR